MKSKNTSCDLKKKKKITKFLQLRALLHIPIYATPPSSSLLHFSYFISFYITLCIMRKLVQFLLFLKNLFLLFNHSAAGREMIHLIILFCGSPKMSIKSFHLPQLWYGARESSEE